jgi:hypothetical protein
MDKDRGGRKRVFFSKLRTVEAAIDAGRTVKNEFGWIIAEHV